MGSLNRFGKLGSGDAHIKNALLASNGVSNTPSSVALDAHNRLLNEHKVKANFMDEFLPGYNEETHQNTVMGIKSTTLSAQEGFIANNVLEFNIQVERNIYRPSDFKLYIKFHIRDSDGNGDLPVNVVPIEGFWWKFFKKIDIRNINTGEYVTKTEPQYCDVENFVKDFFLC